jgi:hypothetical protein
MDQACQGALRQCEQSSALGDSPPAVPQQFFMLHHCFLHLGVSLPASICSKLA